MRHAIIRCNVWSYRGCTAPRRGLFRRDPVKGQLDILLLVLEARLRDEGSDVGEVLSVLLDITEVLTFAAPKIAARTAERARLLAFAGYTPPLSRAAKKALKLGDIGPQHPAYPIWVELAEAEAFHRDLDSAALPPEPLPAWLKS
jgi:hypothetical protein